MKPKNSMLYLRTDLVAKNFYEDIIFKENSIKLKIYMIKWCTNLEYKKLKINQFKDLLVPLNEIVLPIKINNVFCSKSGRRLDIDFTDSEGKKYYMIQDTIYDYNTMNTYIIGRRNSKLEPLLDREFTFKILEDNIELIASGVLKLKKDGKNDEIAVEFRYNKEENFTQATLKSYVANRTIKIQYPTMGMKFDKDVLEFLFKINEEHWYYYDVFPILKWILFNISDKKISLFIIAEIEKEIYSEIYIVNGIVQRYTKTEIISEEEMRINKVIFAKKLEDFLNQKN